MSHKHFGKFEFVSKHVFRGGIDYQLLLERQIGWLQPFCGLQQELERSYWQPSQQLIWQWGFVSVALCYLFCLPVFNFFLALKYSLTFLVRCLSHFVGSDFGLHRPSPGPNETKCHSPLEGPGDLDEWGTPFPPFLASGSPALLFQFSFPTRGEGRHLESSKCFCFPFFEAQHLQQSPPSCKDIKVTHFISGKSRGFAALQSCMETAEEVVTGAISGILCPLGCRR